MCSRDSVYPSRKDERGAFVPDPLGELEEMGCVLFGTGGAAMV